MYCIINWCKKQQKTVKNNDGLVVNLDFKLNECPSWGGVTQTTPPVFVSLRVATDLKQS